MPLPFQPATDVAQISIQFITDGQQTENVLYAKAPGPIDAEMLADLAATVADYVTTNWMPAFGADTIFNRVVTRDLTVESGAEVISIVGHGTAGGDTGYTLPNNASLAIHRDTGFGGKLAKSRIYWNGLTASDMDSANTLKPSAVTGILDKVDGLRSAITSVVGTAWEYGYLQRILNGERLTNANFIEVLSHSLIDNIVDSQRRRLPGRGR